MKNVVKILLLLLSLNIVSAQEIFIAKPYLQIGNNPSSTSLQLLWHTADTNSDWSVEVKTSENASWIKMPQPIATKIAVSNIATHYVFHASLTGLEADSIFKYKVLKNNQEVFTSDAKAPVSNSKPYRFVAFGDIGAETLDQKKLAQQAYLANPDFVVVTGDIVYERGLISEYRSKFWPIYNAEKVDTAGVPLMRKIPMIAAVGNHDTDTRDLDKFPDALAYYYYWEQPLNGPKGEEGGKLVPNLIASDANKEVFLAGAGDGYLKMANYSFDYGNAHWTVIDANPYVDFTDKTFQDWVANDLAKSKDATWHFVMFHHPGFNSSIEHYEQQHSRLLSPIFESGKVDVVFNGHVHNYQRSFPLTFKPFGKGTLMVGGKDGKTIRGRVVNGTWKLDKTFDGKKNTTPKGIIYIVTGAGGQELYNPEQQNDADSWQKFTDKFISTVHSLTVADIEGKVLTIKQLDTDGKVLDSFKITK
jgi:acid phosphatase type 7